MRDVGRDMRERPDGSRLVLAHRRVDVRELNAAIREARLARGELGQGEDAGERRFMTNDGERAFVAGDRIIFLENNRDLGVKNGMLGVVSEVAEGRLSARLDGTEGPDRGREVLSRWPTMRRSITVMRRRSTNPKGRRSTGPISVVTKSQLD